MKKIIKKKVSPKKKKLVKAKVSKKKGVPKNKNKVEKVMKEFSSGSLHSGSKSGPVVSNKKQAIAIALSEARKASKKKR